MTRWAVAIWTALAVCSGMVFSGGSAGGVLCISTSDQRCDLVQSEQCCPTPEPERAPFGPEDDDCCFDVLRPTAAETAAPRVRSARDGAPAVKNVAPDSYLAIPPPSSAESSQRCRYTFRSGPPRDTIAVVRVSRLLL